MALTGDEIMNSWRAITVTTALGLCLSAGTALADSSSFVGHWTLNKTQSKASPDEPMPSAATVDVTAADANHLTWTSKITDPKGAIHSETFDSAPDGKFYPIAGDSKGVTASFTIKGNTIVSIFKGGPNEDTDTLTCVPSPTGKQLICDGTISYGKGHLDTYKDVYDKM